jgi:hypothetical protein
MLRCRGTPYISMFLIDPSLLSAFKLSIVYKRLHESTLHNLVSGRCRAGSSGDESFEHWPDSGDGCELAQRSRETPIVSNRSSRCWPYDDANRATSRERGWTLVEPNEKQMYVGVGLFMEDSFKIVRFAILEPEKNLSIVKRWNMYSYNSRTIWWTASRDISIQNRQTLFVELLSHLSPVPIPDPQEELLTVRFLIVEISWKPTPIPMP